MRTAEEWIKEHFASRVLEDRTCSLSVSDIRKIQADALRHAVGVLQEGQRMYPGTFTGVVLKNVATNIEHKAEEIDGK